jgi:uncharacterized membrane protein YraQ (UPF0718 family)
MKGRRLDASLLILASLTLVAVGFAFGKDASLPLKGLQSSARLFGGVWIELALGFILAGMIDVLVPAASISRWLGADKLHQSVFAGTAAGMVMPGGPYLFFPLAAKLFADGASPGALIAFLSAKTLVSPVRTLTYEAPLMGWPITLARFIPSVLMAPVLGYLGQWLYDVLKAR